MKIEDIEKAAGNYSGSILGFRDSQSVMAKHKAFRMAQSGALTAFGMMRAKYLITKKMVLTIDCIGHPFVCGPNNTEWKETSLIFNVSKWAYIEDLMPTKED